MGAHGFDHVPDAASIAERAVSFAKGNADSSFGDALDVEWARIVAPIDGDATQPLPAPKKPNKCRVHGVCMCTGDGLVFNAFANKFLSSLKNQIKDAHGQDLLMEGNIIIALEPCEVPGGGRAALGDMAAPDFAVDAGAVWLHVGLHYLSPRRPSFRHLLLDEHASTRPGVADGVMLKGTGDFTSRVL